MPSREDPAASLIAAEPGNSGGEPVGRATLRLRGASDGQAEEPSQSGSNGGGATASAGSAAANRGKPADFRGPEVRGSGAGAGGGGGPEDFDTDPQAGGGKLQQPHERAEPTGGADATIGGSH